MCVVDRDDNQNNHHDNNIHYHNNENAACFLCPLEEAKQGSFTYNQGYHRLIKWGEAPPAPCFNSKWGQFLSVTQPTLVSVIVTAGASAVA